MSRSPSPWGQRALGVAPASPSNFSSSSARPPSSNSLVELNEHSTASASSSQSSLVHSTSPPCKPQLPPSPRTAQPITPSILLNPLPASASKSASLLDRLPGKRRTSIVVEVHHSPPPAHFYQDLDRHADEQDDEDEARVGRSTTSFASALSQQPQSFHSNMSPPRPDLSGLRSRSASPISTPRSSSPARPNPALDQPTTSSSTLNSAAPANGSPNSAFVPLSSIMSNRSASSSSSRGSSGQCIRFAPLPPGRRPNRSNSISLGVASRAKMINAQGGQPNLQQARYAGPLQWYEGGDLPEDVYTWRDAQRGLSKIWKKVNGGKDSEAAAAAKKNRSASLSSTTSSGSVDEARRMEREAKSGGNKGEVEHVEEAVVVPEDSDRIDEEGEEDLDTESEFTSPRTPPEGSALGLTNVGIDDVELEKERRRREKGKGKQVDHHVDEVNSRFQMA
ncbi:uncharacterized protein JCM15063_000801 [Sporobolomyces koalae]|uniref:uncharacterized protein n=1 Tax=Sporobolomyces koalae TaxID=500713 RepID=UPI0031767CEA